MELTHRFVGLADSAVCGVERRTAWDRPLGSWWNVMLSWVPWRSDSILAIQAFGQVIRKDGKRRETERACVTKLNAVGNER
ncbi:hypothetical protein RBSWK_01509 [Rhodopirellula baltica SWK14]|uniref:Uncharacterized protein n=1 Tax=Rhodopirellula baltica SWK14 TaxID=993516 RepID=L7CL84_RHOBT|nr:hypothetical protein RBSWK_01509 [Rhodopirellula baltica SWK14]